jgi:hypothetical protein
MLVADRECNLHSFREEALLHLNLKQKTGAVAGQQKVGHRTTIAQLALPGTFIAGAGFEQTARLPLGPPVIIPIKVTAINRLWHRFVSGKAALSAISADLAAHKRKIQNNRTADTYRRPIGLTVHLTRSGA